jgi:NitT/TauT family transport system substrate-binding protein
MAYVEQLSVVEWSRSANLTALRLLGNGDDVDPGVPARMSTSSLSRRTFGALAAMVVLSGAAGCFGGPSDDASGLGGAVEKPDITIGVVPSIGMAPLYVARDQGLFEKEGLNVKLVTLSGGGESLTGLLGGDVDFTFANYPMLVRAQQKGQGKVKVKIVADAVAARPDSAAVVVPRDSPLRDPSDLEGKKIAVPATNSVADLAVMSGMKAARADPSGIKWRSLSYPAMLPKLQGGDIDAAFLEEPYLSVAQAQLGVWTVFEPMVGRLDGIGLSGYAALEKTTQAYPNTVAAFQRAVAEAHRAATTPQGQNALNKALIDQIHVQPEIAAVLHLPAYPLTADPTRLQRVPDLMRQFGLIKEPFDIKPMILENKS